MRSPVWLLLAALVCSAAVIAAEVPQLGAAGFFPSPQAPIGYRGDGNGYFPGAATVGDFWEGTPIPRTPAKGEPRRGDSEIQLADGIWHNIVWKTEMPAWANTQPIVVGDQVITLGEPDMLISVDARTGAVRWTRTVNAWEAAGVPSTTAKAARELWSTYLAVSNFTALDFHFNTCGRYFTKEQFQPMAELFIKQGLPRILAAAKTADPAGQYDGPAQQTVDAINAFLEDFRPRGEGYEGKVNPLQRYIGQRIQAITGVKMPLDSPWDNKVGFGMNAPVSDGQNIYVAFGQGQMACYDLDGNLKWMQYCPNANPNTHHVISPVLADGVLIDMHGNNKLRGLNAATGERLWEANISPTRGGGGYYIASHKIVWLTNGQGRMAVLVTSPGTILRVKDGKNLGCLPYADRPLGGCSMINAGDIVLKGACGDNYNGPVEAYRLTLVNPDEITMTKLWEYPAGRSPGYQPQTVIGDRFYWQSSAGTIFDAATGRALAPGSRDNFLGGYSNLATGTYYYWTGDGSGGMWNQRRADGNVYQCFYSADISNPDAPRGASFRNWLGGRNIPRNPDVERFLPELWAHPDYYNGAGGKPGQFAHADTIMTAQANRLFIRACGFLYCIGDPAEPYAGTPLPTGNPVLDAPTAAQVDALIALLSAPERTTQLAAACALRRLGADAAPAATKLLTLFTSADEREASAGYLGLRALGRHGVAVTDALVAFGMTDRASRLRALTILGELGESAVKAASALLDSETTYPYGIEILAAVHGAEEARALALGKALVTRDKGRGQVNIAASRGGDRADLVAGNLLQAMGAAGQAAAPLIASLPADRRDDRENLRFLGILAAIDPDAAAKRLPEVVTAARNLADNPWDFWRPVSILTALGGRAKSAAPALQQILDGQTMRDDNRKALQAIVRDLN